VESPPENPASSPRPKPERILRITKIGCSDLVLLEAKVQGHTCRALVDSGASRQFISKAFAAKLKGPRVQKSVPDTIKLANGHTVSSDHVRRLPFSLSGYSDSDTFHEVDLEGLT
jgi:hypothetical protein